MVWFIDSLTEIGSQANVFTTVDVITVLILSTVLCFLAAEVYKRTHDGVSYSHNFVQTIVIFGVLVSMIMLIIGSNIARAFTLVGALSIVRFRNALKETRDVGFIFFMMVIGMAVGTRFFGLAITMTLFVCALLLLMFRFSYGTRKHNDQILKITVSSDFKYEKVLEPLLRKWLAYHQLLNIEGSSKSNLELVYLVRFSKKMSRRKRLFLKKIKELNGNKQVHLFGTDHLIY